MEQQRDMGLVVPGYRATNVLIMGYMRVAVRAGARVLVERG
jgi:hypothetical protein